MVLEVNRQDKKLSMSLFERNEFASTIKHYSQKQISPTQITNLCQEISSLLNRANKKSPNQPDLIEQLKKTCQLLWDLLLTNQIKVRLNEGQNNQLVLSLDEELMDIPWELLYDGTDFLCLRFNLGRVIKTQDSLYSVKYRSINSVLKMLILANPTNDLKSAYLEGLYIRNQLDRQRRNIRVDFKSTYIDTLYVKKNLRDYDIVHFAGHCEYDDDDPKNTGWQLEDGRFTTRDILALSHSLSLPNLVFSNACYSAKASDNHTGLDYHEKTYSLAAAFLFSGVRHYIGTSWQIKDAVSLLFAREFYRQVVRGGSIGEAVRQARLSLINQCGISDISWAGYILYGDPNFALFGLKDKPVSRLSRVKKRIHLHKKRILRFAGTVLFIFLFIGMYICLPVKNPGTMFLFSQADKLFLQGKNEQAIFCAKQIIEKEPLFLAAYPLLAASYERLGDKENALKYYFEYSLYSQKQAALKKAACAYTAIGWLYQLFGDYEKAFDFYDKALILSRQNQDKLNEAVSLRKLAVWYIDKENYDRALELLMKSSEINRQKSFIHQHRYNLACDYFDIGLVFINKGDFVSAKEFYKRSQEMFGRLKVKDHSSDYYFNLGEVYLFEKDYNKALELYLRGLNIDQQHNNRLSLAGDYNMLGELYIEMDNLEKAEEYFLKSSELSKEIKLLPELASVSYNLGMLYKQKNKRGISREYLRLAQEISRRIDTPLYQRIRDEFRE